MGIKADAVPQKKSFRVMNQGGGNAVDSIDISILPDTPAEGASTAETAGFNVSVALTKAPDVAIFDTTYPDQTTAENVFKDLCLLAGEVEGKIKLSDFEKAKEDSKKLFERFTANSGSIPNAEPSKD